MQAIFESVIQSILTSLPQGLVTAAVGGIALLAYRFWSTSQPRQVFLEGLRSNLWGAIESIERLNKEDNIEARLAIVDILSAWIKAIGEQCKNDEFLINKNHRLYLRQISVAADIRVTSIGRDRLEIAEQGLLGVRYYTSQVRGKSEQDFTLQTTSMPYEMYILEILHNLNRLLNKYGKGLSLDLTQKVETSQKAELVAFWESRTIKLECPAREADALHIDLAGLPGQNERQAYLDRRKKLWGLF
ncbi:MAG: hypothetical protein AAGH45_05600 [Pseudomonadota bacterium]